MFKEFFGFSEIVIFVILIAIFFYLTTIFNKPTKANLSINPEKDKIVFGFLVLFIWLFISLFIPYFLSFVKLPMIVSRYFINVIPPIIIMAACGLYYIKNNIIKGLLLVIFFLFSFTDIVVVKRYYNSIMKTQFREVSDFVKNNHKNNDFIYSSFEYYFSYYLRKEDNHAVTNISLNQYVDKVLLGEPMLETFWYVDINNPQDKTSDKTQKILDSLYIVDENISLFDAYAKHFHNKKTYKPNIDLLKFKPFKEKNGEVINFSFEIFNSTDETIEASGWAYFNEQSMENTKIHLFLINDNTYELISTETVNRDDVTSYFKSKYNLARSGFKINFAKKNFKAGTYKVALYLLDTSTKKESLTITDKIIKIP
jgi:mannosyltransferase